MTDLSPQARALLGAARDERGPSDAAKVRVRQGVLRRVTATAVAAGTTATVSTTAAATVGAGATAALGGAAGGGATAALGTILAKTAAIGVGTLALAGSAYGVQHLTSPAPTPVVVFHAAVQQQVDELSVTLAREQALINVAPMVAPAPAEPASPTPSLTLGVAVNPPEVAVAAPAESAAILARASASKSALRPSTSSSSVQAAEDDTESAAIRRELEVVRQAHAALQRREPMVSLRVLDDFGRTERGRGSTALAEERAGLRVIALCEMSAPDARARAESFLQTYPHSPLGARVRSACLTR